MKDDARTRTGLVLRLARGQVEQQAAIDAWLRARAPAGLAIVAEGAFYELAVPPEVALVRLAAGCVCCVGLLPLKVTLARLVRTVRPALVLLLVADATHFERVRALVADGALGVSMEESA